MRLFRFKNDGIFIEMDHFVNQLSHFRIFRNDIQSKISGFNVDRLAISAFNEITTQQGIITPKNTFDVFIERSLGIFGWCRKWMGWKAGVIGMVPKNIAVKFD